MVGKVFEKPFKMTNSVLLRKSAFGSFTVNFGMYVCDDIDPTLALIPFFFSFFGFLVISSSTHFFTRLSIDAIFELMIQLQTKYAPFEY